MKLLVVAAWEPELAALRRRCAAVPAHVPPVAFEAVGVGVVEAAVGVTRSVLHHEPTHALFVGTCGAFDGEKLPIGSVIAGRSAHLADAMLLAHRSDLPPPMPARALLDVALHDVLIAAGATSARIVNTVGITTDDDLASTLAVVGEVEHLEAFAFARACAAASVACGVALGVANGVGARGREEWRASHESASARVGDVVYDAIAALVRTSTIAP